VSTTPIALATSTIDATAARRQLNARTVRVGDCWCWTGDKVQGGYGRVHVGGRKYLAHRLSFMLEHGATSLFVLHSCDTPSCWNPAHLRAGTHAENMAERNAKGRQARGPALQERTRQQMQRQAVVTPGMVTDIFARRADGHSQARIAKAHGVSQGTVSRLLRRDPTVKVRQA
jgi:hypothetical protein